MPLDARTALALSAAIALHAALWLALPRSGTDASRHRAQSDLAAVEVDVDDARLEPPSRRPATSDPAAPEVQPRPAALAMRSGGRASPPAEPSAALQAAPEEERGAPAPAPSVEPSRRLSLAELGVGVPIRLPAPARDRAGERHEGPGGRALERSLRQGAAERDRARGIGPSGPIITAVERATHAAVVPGSGSATLRVSVDSRGRVRAVDVIDVDGDRARWTGIARTSLARLGSARLRLPAGARGLVLAIRVESRWALPSGADPGLEIRALGVPLARGQGKRSARLSILEPAASIERVEVPTPTGSYELPVPVIGLVPFGVAGDLSDVGARPRRVVHARVVSQTVL